MDRKTLAKAIDARKSGAGLVIATRLDTAETRLITLPVTSPDPLDRAADEAARRDASQRVEIDGVSWFLNVFNEPPRLYVVGAVHIAQPLSHMAAMAGFSVVVIDPRTAFATGERFPGLHLVTAWPDEALADLPLDRRTAVVTLTHDPKLDDPALVAALGAPCFFIGALGSRKTHAARCARLKAQGFSDAAIERIRGPVGLAIGAISPAEIAVSIMAELIATLRQDPSA
ncbi:MAG: XdhC family protein [Alphaproteobacteria bacterium]|nr:XdhC family protein [Alphaproteobacteria bacterium]